MTIQFTITIADTQIINGIEYTQSHLLQGLGQVRTAYNQRTGESLTDAEWLQWAEMQNLAAWYEQGKGSEPVDPSPIEPVADWQALTDHILGGALYDIYARLTAAQFVVYNPLLTPEENGAIIANANNIAVAAGKLDQAVAVTRVESAVAASFQLLTTTSNYTFTQEEKDLWNPLVASLNFSPLVYLP